MKSAEYEIVRYPSSRIGTLDFGQFAGRKHHVAGLLEIDVTETLASLRHNRNHGVRISFFSWIVKAISTTIAENRQVHALQGKGNSTVVFEDVDISVMVEKTVDGKQVPLPILIRKSNEKPVELIQAEILEGQNRKIKDESDYVISDTGPSRLAMRLYYALPQVLRLFLLRHLLKNPHRQKEMMGTAIITSVGFSANMAGWIIPKSMHNLCFALGSVTKKPWVVSNQVEVRDILHLTVIIDHDVVDGLPAARFVSNLVNRLRKGF